MPLNQIRCLPLVRSSAIRLLEFSFNGAAFPRVGDASRFHENIPVHSCRRSAAQLSIQIGFHRVCVARNLAGKGQESPVDYGFGPVRALGLRGQTSSSAKPGNPPRSGVWRRKQDLGLPKSSRPNAVVVVAVAEVAQAAWRGRRSGPAFPWPIIPIHIALLPRRAHLKSTARINGCGQERNLSMTSGIPDLEDGPNAHSILPNGTSTDIFCSAASLMGGLAGAHKSDCQAC